MRLGSDRKGTRHPNQRSVLIVVMAILLSASILFAGCDDRLARASEMTTEGDLAGANRLYVACLNDDPGCIEALRELAANYMIAGRYAEALPLQERVVELDPRDAQTRVELGFNYLGHQDRPAAAVEMFAEAVSLDASPKNLCFLGQGYKALGQIGPAEAVFRESIEKDPTYPFAYILLRQLLVDTGRNEAAAELMSEANSFGVEVQADPSTARSQT